MNDGYQDALKAVHDINKLTYKLKGISSAMFTLGMEEGGERISRLAYEIEELSEIASKGISGGMADQLEQAQEASANMINAALAAARSVGKED